VRSWLVKSQKYYFKYEATTSQNLVIQTFSIIQQILKIIRGQHLNLTTSQEFFIPLIIPQFTNYSFQSPYFRFSKIRIGAGITNCINLG
jgi:hypothetical protein